MAKSRVFDKPTTVPKNGTDPDPDVVDIPVQGVELWRQIQIAQQAFNMWAGGFLAGKGYASSYAPSVTVDGLKLVRQVTESESVPGNTPEN